MTLDSMPELSPKSLSKAKRIARACERCRQHRRRCILPNPCSACVSAGVPCVVRTKARPLRRLSGRSSLWTTQSATSPDNNAGSTVPGDLLVGTACSTAGTTASTPPYSPTASPKATRKATSLARPTTLDAFDLLKDGLRDVLLERYGYDLECDLREPFLAGNCATHNAALPVHQHRASLDSKYVWNLLLAFHELKGWSSFDLVDLDGLHAAIAPHGLGLPQITPSSVQTLMAASGVLPDPLALSFAALALGAVAIGEQGLGSSFFGISTEAAKHCVGDVTLERCLVCYLHHAYSLHAGMTSNYARGFLIQAIQHAHDLRLQHSSHGTQGLQLDLLIYMADQYYALDYNTELIIQSSESLAQTFAQLGDARPHLRLLINLVILNGIVIERMSRTPCLTSNDVSDLEAMVGNALSQQTNSIFSDNFTSLHRTYESLARVHMLCCRLKLRAHILLDHEAWVSTVSVCLQAAQGIFSTYFQLFHSVLEDVARQGTGQTPLSARPITFRLPPTWRQVKRIMTAAFVVMFAFTRNELSHHEASRYMAMARLLLEDFRRRWGDKLDNPLRTLTDLCNLAGIRLSETIKLLLCELSDERPRPCPTTVSRHDSSMSWDATGYFSHQSCDLDIAAVAATKRTDVTELSVEAVLAELHSNTVYAFDGSTSLDLWDISGWPTLDAC